MPPDSGASFGPRSIVRRAGAVVSARPATTRWMLAGPGALLAAVLFMAAMPVWLPAGASGIDNIVYPVILAPLFWAIAFIYACLEENLPRGAAVIAAAIVVQGAVVAVALSGGIG